MLDSLYISKSRIRRDLLALFFTNPGKKYYLRELERILGYSAGSIRREILKFMRDGLFVTESVGNLLYYTLNSGHPLFEELKSIVQKTVGVEGSLRNILSTIEGIELSFIFGSFATGKVKPDSDVDLMIVGDTDFSRLNEEISSLERKLKREINISVYSQVEYEERKNEASGFIMELLRSPKIILTGSENDL